MGQRFKIFAKSALPARLWDQMKRLRRRLRSRLVTTFRAFGPRDVAAALQRVGLTRGDVVMVHSSWGSFEGFDGTPKQLISTIEQVIGPEGTLLMPTMPFSGSAIDYALGDPVFDPRRTPSAMGLLTEVFRRGSSTVRSAHPTHSVAAKGPGALDLLRDHHLADSPCGQGTPWQRLIEEDARILFLGVSTDHNTFVHAIQSLLEPHWSHLPDADRILLCGLTNERYPLRVRMPGGEEFLCRSRLFDRQHVRSIDNDRLLGWLRASNDLASITVKGVPYTVMPARQAFEEATRRALRGEFLVDLPTPSD